MSNTYRAPTEAETEAYKTALDEALLNEVLLRVQPKDRVAVAKTAIESVLGPCTYEQETDTDGSHKRGTVVTQCTPGEDGAQIRFTLNAQLS